MNTVRLAKGTLQFTGLHWNSVCNSLLESKAEEQENQKQFLDFFYSVPTNWFDQYHEEKVLWL